MKYKVVYDCIIYCLYYILAYINKTWVSHLEKKKVYGMVLVIKWRQFAVEMHSVTKVHIA